MKIKAIHQTFIRTLLIALLALCIVSACGGRSSSSSTNSNSGSGTGGTTTPTQELGLNVEGAERSTSTGSSWIIDSNNVLKLSCDRDCNFDIKSASSITTFENVTTTDRTWQGTVRNIGSSGDLLSLTITSRADAKIKANPSIIVRPDFAYQTKLAAGNTNIIERNITTVKVLRDTRLDIQSINNSAQNLTSALSTVVTNIDGSALADLSPYGEYVVGTTSNVPLKGEAGLWAFQFNAQSSPSLQGFDVAFTKNTRQTIFKIRFMDDNDKSAGGNIVNAGVANKPQCSACHGADGKSPNANGANKTINGKPALTTINLIRAYRDGTNPNATATRDKRDRMNLLTPEEVMKVAWYLSDK